MRKWLVKLSGAPDRIVEADSPDDAWILYQMEMGIISTVHQPQIVEV